MQATLEPAVLAERTDELREQAAELHAQARSLQLTAKDSRLHVGRRRRDTVQVIWRSRRLRFDRYGPIVAAWNGDGDGSQSEPLDLSHLDEAVNGVFRVGLIMSGLANSVDSAQRQQVVKAVAALDAVIRDLRRASLNEQRRAKMTPDRDGWLSRIQEATAGIDELLGSSGPISGTAFELHEASQAAHRAIIALAAHIDPQ